MESAKDTKSYHEQKYVDNTLRLRSILKTLPPFAKDYFRALNLQLQREHESLMHMTSAFSFIFLWKIIRFIKIIL